MGHAALFESSVPLFVLRKVGANNEQQTEEDLGRKTTEQQWLAERKEARREIFQTSPSEHDADPGTARSRHDHEDGAQRKVADDG